MTSYKHNYPNVPNAIQFVQLLEIPLGLEENYFNEIR